MAADISGGAAAIGTSLWKAVNPPPATAAALCDKLSTDVLIIGAGVAGLSLGLHLGERKADLVVLEADEDANSATGTSAGIIAPQLVRTTPHAVLKRLGTETGARVLRLIAESGHYTFGLIDEWSIECGATRAGFLNPVHGKQGAAAHAQLVEEHLAHGSVVVLPRVHEDLLETHVAGRRRVPGVYGSHHWSHFHEVGPGADHVHELHGGFVSQRFPFALGPFAESPLTRPARRVRDSSSSRIKRANAALPNR